MIRVSDPLPSPVLRALRLRSLVPGGAVALGLCLLFGPAPLFGQGEAGEEPVEHFGEHLDDFEKEVQELAVLVDGIVKAHGDGNGVGESIDKLVEAWEHVEIHEVIEAEAIHLYPPIWQGIYAMKQAAEKSGSAAAMARAGERTKATLWQSLGGLRALARLPRQAVADAQHARGLEEHMGYVDEASQADNRIELTGDDNMRFNETRFVVRAGEPVTLRFENIGELPKEVMGHNVVVLKRGTSVERFGLAAAEASENNFIPAAETHVENMVSHTELLGPGEVDEITFTLEEPGEYPFICSFTAHFRLMKGVIQAVSGVETSPVQAIFDRIDSAVENYAEGKTERAEALVHSAYINIFEGLEGDLIERDPELVLQLELDFNAGLPVLFQEGAPVEKVRAQVELMRQRLKRAEKFLDEAKAERSSVF